MCVCVVCSCVSGWVQGSTIMVTKIARGGVVVVVVVVVFVFVTSVVVTVHDGICESEGPAGMKLTSTTGDRGTPRKDTERYRAMPMTFACTCEMSNIRLYWINHSGNASDCMEYMWTWGVAKSVIEHSSLLCGSAHVAV